MPKADVLCTQLTPSNELAIFPSAPDATYTPFAATETDLMSELPKEEEMTGVQLIPSVELASFPAAPNAINLLGDAITP